MMELLHLPHRRNAALLSLNLLTLLLLTATFVHSYTHFTPTDNHLINCGSDASSTAHHIDNRIFIGDNTHIHSSFRLTSPKASYSVSDPSSNSSNPIYRTARVFKSASSYRFSIHQKGTHIIRLHFQPDPSRLFRVYAGDFLLIGHGVNESTNPNLNPVIKEFFVSVDEDELEIRFVPTKGSLAYVNAIEVISAPLDLIVDEAELVVGAAQPRTVFDGLTLRALETLYRINVGGLKVTPFNDTLWRTWLPDDPYLVSEDSASSIVKVYSTGPIKYQTFGATHLVAPDSVYNTARAITSEKLPSIPKLNFTWTFPVEEGYGYLVRLHFCDIASMALDMLHFNVYVNGFLAYENLDLSSVSFGFLASPYYADFVVNGCGENRLNVSVGPSELSRLHNVNAVLNGVEIMKISNSMKSLDGEFGMHGKGSMKGGICGALPMVAVICLLVLMSMVIKKRLATVKDSRVGEWLSLGGSNGGVKYNNIPLAGKL